jgi:competence ComEA-like helix-hairpin-helix protein
MFREHRELGTCRYLGVVRRGLIAVLAVAFAVGAPGKVHAGGKEIDGVINLNTAPAELLSLLPGIGPSKARQIVAYRSRHSFRTVDELVRVKGIGRRMVREMRIHLATAGPSTAHGAAVVHPALAPVPVAPPPAPALRPLCRVPVVVPVRLPVGRLARAPPMRMPRSTANHCAPPA